MVRPDGSTGIQPGLPRPAFQTCTDYALDKPLSLAVSRPVLHLGFPWYSTLSWFPLKWGPAKCWKVILQMTLRSSPGLVTKDPLCKAQQPLVWSVSAWYLLGNPSATWTPDKFRFAHLGCATFLRAKTQFVGCREDMDLHNVFFMRRVALI